MDCNDRIGMWQKSHTAQPQSECQTLLEWPYHIGMAQTRQRNTNSSHQSPTKCLLIESSHADDPVHFTLIRQENCDSKKPGQRPSMFCDSVPQGRQSRSEWRTVDPVAQRPGLSRSASRHQTFIAPRLRDVASHEAVKFNDQNQAVCAADMFSEPAAHANSAAFSC